MEHFGHPDYPNEPLSPAVQESPRDTAKAEAEGLKEMQVNGEEVSPTQAAEESVPNIIANSAQESTECSGRDSIGPGRSESMTTDIETSTSMITDHGFRCSSVSLKMWKELSSQKLEEYFKNPA